MILLSIETSCDETALAIVETAGMPPALSFRVLADNILSQISIHKEYGGVFPMMAKREHARALVPLLVKTLRDAGLYKKTSRHVIESPLRKDFQEILDHEPELFAQFITEIPHVDRPAIDAIAVTQGPGLEPALWVGINFAKALSLVWKIPVISVNHMEGHLVSALLKRAQTNADLPQKSADKIKYQIREVEFPILGLLVSGGHTELVLMREWGRYEVIGETRDDAVGEAFDKVARMLGLPYPGGPQISALAETARTNTETIPEELLRGSALSPRTSARELQLPRPMLRSNDYDFSFSGLKTAVLYLIKKIADESAVHTENSRGETSPRVRGLTSKIQADIAREFEDACIEVLVTKTLRAAEEYGVRTIVMGGGVSANKHLRETLQASVAEKLPRVPLFIPSHALATDNALMIAVAGALKIDTATMDIATLRADGNWRLA